VKAKRNGLCRHLARQRMHALIGLALAVHGLEVAISQTISEDAKVGANSEVEFVQLESNSGLESTNSSNSTNRSFETERSYLEFREERMERRLNRSKIVLRNLQAREQYVERALTFQTGMAAALVQRAANDSIELHSDLEVLRALALRAPGLRQLANTSLPADVARFSTLFSGVRANLTELLESPIWEQITDINDTFYNQSGSYEELDLSLNRTEEKLSPWEENYTREARRLATRHVDGLLLKMADHLASTVEETTKQLETAGDVDSDGGNMTSPAPELPGTDGEDNAFGGYLLSSTSSESIGIE